MDIKAVLKLCKKTLGREVRYIKRLENGTFEVHEIKRKCIVRYIIGIEDDTIIIISESEEKHKTKPL